MADTNFQFSGIINDEQLQKTLDAVQKMRAMGINVTLTLVPVPVPSEKAQPKLKLVN